MGVASGWRRLRQAVEARYGPGTEPCCWFAEFDWLAVDRVGQVGEFAVGSYGPVPFAAFERSSAVRDALVAILELPRASGCLVASPDGTNPDWVEMAEFGFFGYDWRDRKRGYQRLTVPTVPRRVEELPALLARICRLVAIDTEFARARHIDVRSIPEEVVWPTVSTNRLL